MRSKTIQVFRTGRCAESTSELLILPDGRILVHNLTPTFAALLRALNPDDGQIRPRADGSEVSARRRQTADH
jgi:hypothetical protein